MLVNLYLVVMDRHFWRKAELNAIGGRVAYLFGDEKTNLSLLVDGCGS